MEKFVIIDGNNLMFRAFYALPQLANFNGEISNAVFGFTNMIVKIIKEINPKYMAVAFDVSKKTFRHDKYPDYKGTRKPTPEELLSQFPIAKDLLKKMNICVVEKDGLEADDLIGSLSRTFDTENIIVTADRDSFQLINSNTHVLCPKKGLSETILLTEDNLKENYGVNPNQVIDLKSLMGDSSDNIPGVAGVGEKTAIDLISKFGTLDGIYENLDKLTEKQRNKLEISKESAYMSQWLATIVTNEKLNYKLEDFTYDYPFNQEVLNVFKRYQFNSLIKKEELFDLTKNIKKEEIGIVEINTVDGLAELINILEKSKEICIYFDNDFISIYNIKEYKIVYAKDLLTVGLSPNDVLKSLKPILENNNISKILFDIKSIKHFLDKFDINLNGADFDCLVARYLINSIAKPNVTINDVLLECELDTNAYGYAINKLKEYYYSKLKEMELMEVFENIEMPLIEVLYDMEKSGFKVDSVELKNLENKYREEILEIESLIYDIVGHKFNIASPKQLGEVLFDELNLNIPSNKKKSTSIEILNDIVDKHPIVRLIIRYRTITKLYSTYIIGFENLLTEDDKIHTVFNQTLTSTGRLSSSEPNLQNIPVRTDEGRNLRKVFIPSNKGGFIVGADYSQIELRLLANFSGDEKLIKAYNNGEDIHTRTASEIFGVAPEMVDSKLRRDAKAINFGIVYGISDFGLSQNIGISRKEAGNYIKLYFERYPMIEKYMQSNVEYCREHGYVKTYFGRIRPIPEINSSNYNLRNFGERAAMNMPLQGTASDIIKLAMIKIYNELKSQGLKSKIILQVHDELVVDVYPGELEIVKEILRKGMETVVNLAVKLEVNIESGTTWYDAK